MKTPKIFLIVLVTSVFWLVIWTLHAQQNWLLRIDNKESLSIRDFEKDFLSFLELQILNNPLSELSELKALQKDRGRKKLYLQDRINEILLLEDAKSKGVYKEKEIDDKVEQISGIFKRMLIKQYYIRKIVAKKSGRPSNDLIQHYFNKISKDPRSKNWNLSQKKKASESEARLQQLQKTYLETLDALRGEHRIQINSNYLESLN